MAEDAAFPTRADLSVLESDELTFGDSSTVGNQLAINAISSDFKSRWYGIERVFSKISQRLDTLEGRTGIRLGADYRALALSSSSSLTDEYSGGSGYLTLLGRWTPPGLDGPNRGYLNVEFQARNNLFANGISAAALSREIGYVGDFGVTFNDHNANITKLYWLQLINDGQVALALGYMDPTDFIDIIGVLVPRMAFFNGGSVINYTQSFPTNGFGAAGRVFLTNQIYLGGVLADANGSIPDVEWFSGGPEFMHYAEIGWTPARNQFYRTKIGVGYWNRDPSQTGPRERGEGVLVSANVTLNDVWMPYVRLGLSDGDASLYDRQVTAGFTYVPGEYGDLLGTAYTWASPSNADLKDQQTLEAFYRFQVASNISLTFDAQVIKDPARDPHAGLTGVFGVGFRISL